MEWKLADAKNRLSELVTKASTEGPQTIRRHDATVVVISEKTYRTLTGERRTFKDLLLNVPSLEGVDLERDRSPMREVDL
jgi:prevent-host-death family protein